MEHWAQPAKPTLREGVAETGEAQMSLVAGIEGLASLGQRLLKTICCNFFKQPICLASSLQCLRFLS